MKYVFYYNFMYYVRQLDKELYQDLLKKISKDKIKYINVYKEGKYLYLQLISELEHFLIYTTLTKQKTKKNNRPILRHQDKYRRLKERYQFMYNIANSFLKNPEKAKQSYGGKKIFLMSFNELEKLIGTMTYIGKDNKLKYDEQHLQNIINVCEKKYPIMKHKYITKRDNGGYFLFYSNIPLNKDFDSFHYKDFLKDIGVNDDKSLIHNGIDDRNIFKYVLYSKYKLLFLKNFLKKYEINSIKKIKQVIIEKDINHIKGLKPAELKVKSIDLVKELNILKRLFKNGDLIEISKQILKGEIEFKYKEYWFLKTKKENEQDLSNTIELIQDEFERAMLSHGIGYNDRYIVDIEAKKRFFSEGDGMNVYCMGLIEKSVL